MKILPVLFLFLVAVLSHSFANVSIDSLTVDYQKTPLGIDQPVDSGISLGIEYAGQPLKPTTRYNWTYNGYPSLTRYKR